MSSNTITEKKHAVLGPSGWDWWSNCPGGPVLSEGRERKSSIYAFEGTVAHEIADYCLERNCEPESFVGNVFKGEGHEVEVDMDMADHINTYLAHVRNMIEVEKGDVLMPEQQVPIGHLTGETGAEGTSDCIGITNDGKRLVVIDLKYGRGVEVSAEGNGQGRIYALGALEKFGMLYDEIEEVEIVIIQPRVGDGEPSRELLTVDELRAFGDEVTIAAGRVEQARQAHVADLVEGWAPAGSFAERLNPGEKQCKFCPAKAICPALRGEVEASMALVSQAADPEEFADLTLPKKASSIAPPNTYSPEQLAEAFRAIPLIEEWLSAVGKEMHDRLMAGDQIPGHYLGVGKAGARQWGDAKAAEAELKQRYKVDEMYTKKVISPTQAEKLMKDKPRVWAKVIAAAGIVQPPGGPKVCREGVDKNPPYQLPKPEDFPDLSGEGPSNPLLD